MEEFRVIIAGSRNFQDFELLEAKMDFFLSQVKSEKKIVIVCGKAKGADILGERYGRKNGYEVREFPALWDTEGKSAGYRRNVRMAENADALVAFWDGKSRGTEHMISIAAKKNVNNPRPKGHGLVTAQS